MDSLRGSDILISCDDLLRSSLGLQLWYLNESVTCSKAVSVLILSSSECFRLALASRVILLISEFSLFFSEDRVWSIRSKFPSFSFRLEFSILTSSNQCSFSSNTLALSSKQLHLFLISSFSHQRMLLLFLYLKYSSLISASSLQLYDNSVMRLDFSVWRVLNSWQYSLISLFTSLIWVFCRSLTTSISAIYLFKLSSIRCFSSDASLTCSYNLYFVFWRSAHLCANSSNSQDWDPSSFSWSDILLQDSLSFPWFIMWDYSSSCTLQFS